ncbi:Putative nitrogen fixation protein NifQ (plasmid) [Neorhizobium galegae bv. officinalis bv. officinalis str. HAMBI 1141]|uniref:Putative nitrogen fixation protein NifQ n=1 Tax=Neorhizobium galegae bv. officinalis bv. officinalis str. HAMBI 1141 TaxID=1028801 RepID=A0A068TJ43_NEOGA|nr:hypothetical protein F4V88_29750 [Neorhizobium galegae]KAB1108830.1 hypothetical protein F4V89_28760 [Neorhizobium galegae]CDN58442.1 Putative nitrogen fixation protein NifQ [Neorhizobium galegae bv. officinalis bv. officinalis str. HAMBI 1141]
MAFDCHLSTSGLLHVLKKGAARSMTVSSSKGISATELDDALCLSAPAAVLQSFAVPNLQAAESRAEEEVLLGLLPAHARRDNAMRAFFAETLAGPTMGQDHLWRAVGLYDRSELSHLLGSMFQHLRRATPIACGWKKYLSRKLCEADGHISMGCTKLPTAHGAPDLLRTRRRRKTCKKPVGERSPSRLPRQRRRERFGSYKEDRQ